MSERARDDASSNGKIPASEDPMSTSGTQPKGERRRRTKRVRKEKRTFWQKSGRTIAGALLILGALFAAVASYMLVVYPSSEGTGTGRAVEVTFESGESTGAVIEKLQGAGLLASPRTFAIYARLAGLKTAAGRHLLTDDATPGELVRRLERNGARAKITIPEGWTRFDIARRLEAQQVASQTAFLEATADPDVLKELAPDADSFEGFLFPATYDFPKDSDPREVVRRLHNEFERRWGLVEQNHRLGIAQLEASLGWGKKEIVTLASIVEKEAALDEERPIIASVFLNRLRDASFKKKILQCDPTSGYGCLVLKDRVPACAGYTGKITHAINFDPANTYSTYVREGLPPGPIGNPGLKSLQAVVAPASTKYLYFVARGEGRKHVFSETLDEHNAAVKDLKYLRERTSPQK